MTNIFLSHKKDFSTQAQELALALNKIAPGAAIFLSEDIEKGRDWRDAVNRALAEAKCFILLYTDPKADWSWCFYEAGAFVSNFRKPRPVFCLHPKTVEPPSPLANLQAIQAEQADIEKWILEGLCDVIKCRPKQTEGKLKATVKDIAKLVNATAPLQEVILKPYIWIEPKWSGNWTKKIPKLISLTLRFRLIGIPRGSSDSPVSQISRCCLSYAGSPATPAGSSAKSNSGSRNFLSPCRRQPRGA